MKSSCSRSEVSVSPSNHQPSDEQPPSTAGRGWIRRLWGGLLMFVGFMLSPLSWWNDLLLNLPLALAFAWLVSVFHPPAFKAAVVIGYALTNVLGFVLMHVGGDAIAGPRSQRHLGRDIGIALLYTGVVFALMQLGILQPVLATSLQR